MKSVTICVAWAAVLAATAGGGLVHGHLTNRWGTPAEMVEAGARLQRISGAVGQWRQTSSKELTDAVKEMLECTGDITRNYVNQKTNAAVSVSLIVGPSGPMSVHTPEICFDSRNHQLTAPRKRVQLVDSAGVTHELWQLTFRSQDVQSRSICVYYGWSTGDAWTAADDPRFGFAGSRYLYKIQVACHEPLSDNPEADELYAFLVEFLPWASAEMMTPPSTL